MSSDRGSAPRIRPVALLVAVLVVAVACALAAVPHAGRWLAISESVGDPEAIVVLGSHEWERLPAASVAARHPRARVLLTEPVVPTPENCHRCGERVEWLRHLGVDAKRIEVLTDRVRNTYDEAEAVANYCRRHSCTRVLVVTSPYHARRALATFRAVLPPPAFETGVVPARPPDWAEAAGTWWRHPYDRAYVGYELTAVGWYVVRYRISPFVRVDRPALADVEGRRTGGRGLEPEVNNR